jgi:hypothetical protein
MSQSAGMRFAFLSVLIFAFSHSAWAQATTATVTGRVAVPTNAPIPRVSVELTKTATQNVRSISTDDTLMVIAGRKRSTM